MNSLTSRALFFMQKGRKAQTTRTHSQNFWNEERRARRIKRLAHKCMKVMNLVKRGTNAFAEFSFRHRRSAMAILIAGATSVQAGYASDDLFTKISDTSKALYGKILGISTALLVVVLAIALIMRMVSKNPRSIEIWTGWAKSALISWAILNCLGLLLAYAKDILPKNNMDDVW